VCVSVCMECMVCVYGVRYMRVEGVYEFVSVWCMDVSGVCMECAVSGMCVWMCVVYCVSVWVCSVRYMSVSGVCVDRRSPGQRFG